MLTGCQSFTNAWFAVQEEDGAFTFSVHNVIEGVGAVLYKSLDHALSGGRKNNFIKNIVLEIDVLQQVSSTRKDNNK
mgnify:CR=1 FL=1